MDYKPMEICMIYKTENKLDFHLCRYYKEVNIYKSLFIGFECDNFIIAVVYCVLIQKKKRLNSAVCEEV